MSESNCCGMSKIIIIVALKHKTMLGNGVRPH